MVKVVVDSNIFIDYLRIRKGALADLIAAQQKGTIEIFVSAITVFELFSGKSSRKDYGFIGDLLAKMNVVPLDDRTACLAGEINRDSKTTVGPLDLLIGATALSLNASLATGNKKHFAGIPKLKFF